MVFLQGPSSTFFFSHSKISPMISFPPKTSMSICQPVPPVLSSPALGSLRSTWHICRGCPTGTLHLAGFEIKLLILLSKPAPPPALQSPTTAPSFTQIMAFLHPLFHWAIKLCLFFLLSSSLSCALNSVLTVTIWAPHRWLGTSSDCSALYLFFTISSYPAARLAHSLDHGIYQRFKDKNRSQHGIPGWPVLSWPFPPLLLNVKSSIPCYPAPGLSNTSVP